MKSTKVLKIKEFLAIKENLASNIHVQEVTGKTFSATQTEPLYESESFPSAKKIENNFIVLPDNPKCRITIDSLTLNLTKYLQSQRVGGESGFSVGHYFSDEYKSGESVYNEKSLCVSLVGEISDRAGTIATASTRLVTRSTATRSPVNTRRSWSPTFPPCSRQNQRLYQPT